MYIHDEQSIDQPFQSRLVTTEGEDRNYSWYNQTCAAGHIIMSDFRLAMKTSLQILLALQVAVQK